MGPPLPAFETDEDMSVVRDWLAYTLPRKAPDAALPADDLSSVRGMTDVVKIMQTHWSAHQCQPPAAMTGGEIASESEHFPRDVFTLLDAFQNVLKR
jgi:hypothetical protein